MDHFYANYDNNIARIFEIRERISGTHYIDKDRAELWIDSQLNESRRLAARLLIDNTYYVTFNQVFEYVRDLIIRIYEDIGTFNPDVCLYIGSKTKSYYFMSVIAIYFIRSLGYTDPEIINTFSMKLNKPLIIIDDMSYTGIQASKMFRMIKTTNKVYLGLIGASETAAIFLKNIGYELYVENIYPHLRNVVGPERFVDISYYFSPFAEGDTCISIYFDHKIADELSTFMKVLMYGPVLPCNLNYYFEDIDLVANGGVQSTIIEPDYDSSQWTDKDRLIQHESEIARNNELDVMLEYLEQLKEIDNKCDYSQNNISFIPFIKGCEQLPFDVEIIKYMPYSLFMMSNNYLGGNIKLIRYKKLIRYEQYIRDLENPNIRCPSSWYKSIKYQLD